MLSNIALADYADHAADIIESNGWNRVNDAGRIERFPVGNSARTYSVITAGPYFGFPYFSEDFAAYLGWDRASSGMGDTEFLEYWNDNQPDANTVIKCLREYAEECRKKDLTNVA